MRVKYLGLLWGLAAVCSLATIFWVYPRAQQFAPKQWTVTRGEAIELAMKSFESLGETASDPYIVTELDDDFLIEQRLFERREAMAAEDLAASPLGQQVIAWRVTVYEGEAPPNQWRYQAKISLTGEVLDLLLGVPEEQEGVQIDDASAIVRANAFLEANGFDRSVYEEPVPRRRDLMARTDLTLRYQDHRAVLGSDVPYGVEVLFVGDQLAGFQSWIEDPERQQRLAAVGSSSGLVSTLWILMPYFLFPFIGIIFLRKYHEGEIGVRRAVQVFALVWGCGLIVALSTSRAVTEGNNFGPLSRVQTTWIWGLQILVLWFSAIALMSALGWAVGEARCRTQWGHKLAAFDALFQRRWANETLAASSGRGLAAAAVLNALLVLAVFGAGHFGLMEGISQTFGPWWENSPWPGLSFLAMLLGLKLYANLFTWLFVLPVAIRRFGRPLGAGLVALMATALFWPPRFLFPMEASIPLALFETIFLIVLFLRYDLLTAMTASLGSSLLSGLMPFLLADNPFLVLQGVLPLALLSLPFLLSCRHLGSGTVFEYRYQDIPPHVRRIAERERQRVELETARGIQTSILPELPPQLAGIELAHAYLPASEVGGDFYDVLDLEDGRLAVAVGDVAGHGVSSGLVMSMAKSTLALQVTVNPEVEQVVSTLNRMVYRSARQRLLTTLCYALVDHQQMELTYASAGHLAPYRISSEGEVEALAAAAYPLGVRDQMQVQVRTIGLQQGDSLFMFSDGLVEARRMDSDEVFGFDRLEESLRRHAGGGAMALKNGVLQDIRRFSGSDIREDDQTIVVLKLPS